MCHPVMHPALEELIAFNRVSEGNIFIRFRSGHLNYFSLRGGGECVT